MKEVACYSIFYKNFPETVCNSTIYMSLGSSVLQFFSSILDSWQEHGFKNKIQLLKKLKSDTWMPLYEML